MIYELRTYRLVPRSIPEVERLFGEAYEHRRKYSELTAFWHTEIGPLNEIVHVWGYADLAERARIRAEAAKDPNWPPKIREHTEKNHPKYLEAPQEWLGLTQNENTWTYSKKVIDERRAAGKVVNGSVFGVYK